MFNLHVSVVFPKPVSLMSTTVTFVNPLFVNVHNNNNNLNEYIGMSCIFKIHNCIMETFESCK